MRWAGSKRRIVPHLLTCMPKQYVRYIEPFAGSACLFFALRPRVAILADFNDELMRTYRTIACHPRLVARAVASRPVGAAPYYSIRKLDPEQLNDVDRAARFMYLNRYCFNGVYRTNRENRFNVPFGSRPGMPLTEAEYVRCSIALRNSQLLCADFEETISLVQKDDFVYLDPPYLSSDRPSLGEYGYGAFARADLPRLYNALNALDRRGSKVLLSYANDPDLRDALKGWSIVEIEARRQIAGGTQPRFVTEILASNSADIESLLHE